MSEIYLIKIRQIGQYREDDYIYTMAASTNRKLAEALATQADQFLNGDARASNAALWEHINGAWIEAHPCPDNGSTPEGKLWLDAFEAEKCLFMTDRHPDLPDSIHSLAYVLELQNEHNTFDASVEAVPDCGEETSAVRHESYRIAEPAEGFKTSFTDEEKAKLRPIAETLAMLDSNAFFSVETGDGHEWFETYLPQAHALYEGNGGDNG